MQNNLSGASFALSVLITLMLASGVLSESEFNIVKNLNLNLNPDQIKHLSCLEQDLLPQKELLEKNLTQKQNELNKLLQDQNTPNHQIAQIRQEIASLNTQLSDFKVNLWIKIKNELNPEQKALLRDWLIQH